jgi:hypothetical protein
MGGRRQLSDHFRWLDRQLSQPQDQNEVRGPAEPDASKPVLNVAATQPDPPLLNPEAEKPRDPAPAPSSRAAATLPDKPAVPAAPGILAVSSPTSVDIYKDQAYLGSVPVSLELPAGMHALEYRHGSLRRIVTHVINSNETTRAMITFEVSVQINSRPWAEVFLDGLERKPLGQTPLSGVRVPIGGVLLFENPQFEPKRYRVTGNETGIQVVFP